MKILIELRFILFKSERNAGNGEGDRRFLHRPVQVIGQRQLWSCLQGLSPQLKQDHRRQIYGKEDARKDPRAREGDQRHGRAGQSQPPQYHGLLRL